MNNLDFCKFLISINKEIIDKTALSNCHCIGLNSFIINEKPKIRLFVAEDHCQLFDKFDFVKPIIPIHPHKYDDIFLRVEGDKVDYIYEVSNDGYEFSKYNFARLSDNETEIKYLGKENLILRQIVTNIESLKANQLHTVRLIGSRCSWMVLETFKDENFEQVAYHQNLVKINSLNQKMENGFDYLMKYFQIN